MKTDKVIMVSCLLNVLFLSSGCTDSDTKSENSVGTTTDVDSGSNTDREVEVDADADIKSGNEVCDSEPRVMTTADGVEFVRTPDSCFLDLPQFPYQAKFVEIDGLRQGYVEDGPADANPILLLHGQPSWSYLYRKMIPVLMDAGHRVIAMDHIGMGRSDKPIDIEYYRFLGHVDRLEGFINTLNLRNITLFCQDWGCFIGLHVAGKHPDWFDRIVVGNGTLPLYSEGSELYPNIENPNKTDPDLVAPYAVLPPQQPLLVDEDGNFLIARDPNSHFVLMEYCMKSPSFRPSEFVEALTWFDIPADEELAYDAPFPSRIYMAGPRIFPSLVNDMVGKNQAAWDGLTTYEKPFLTIWAINDPGSSGSKETQNNLIDNIPGAQNQPHTRLPEASHFLQEDQGKKIAGQIVEFITANPL